MIGSEMLFKAFFPAAKIRFPHNNVHPKIKVDTV